LQQKNKYDKMQKVSELLVNNQCKLSVYFMPITKSAKKALRQSKRRKKENLTWKMKIKNLQQEIKNLVEEKKIDKARELLPTFYKTIDKAAKSNIIKKNTAARKKSRMTSFVSKVEGSK
jgi:small subunit ribosomal protein S20